MEKSEIVVGLNQLMEARYKLSVREQRIISYLVSQMNVDDENSKIYSLSIKDFCEMTGVTGIKEITHGLQRKLVKITKEGVVHSVTWLSLAVHNENEGTIDIRIDPLLKPFLLQLKQELTEFQLKSSNAIRLYELLKQYIVIGEKRFTIDELKEYMGISKEGYKKYADFKRKVIRSAEKEINEKTGITFHFKEIKKGRSVESLHFFVKHKANS
ncbi:replication initiation protein [Metabacillus fastidiosus]|uniref:replication initiation protein n=1 Tax=Metabacillus fastidiosus TaxID=1458 RepID=UPI003D2A29F6